MWSMIIVVMIVSVTLNIRLDRATKKATSSWQLDRIIEIFNIEVFFLFSLAAAMIARLISDLYGG